MAARICSYKQYFVPETLTSRVAGSPGFVTTTSLESGPTYRPVYWPDVILILKRLITFSPRLESASLALHSD